ncbi:peptidase domain-containing ABC transporter [uncultured Draconibacterium sp.]|uniref:peptidase domain-containing ABC transporter n=1 Tax=uncultured Draconibacterium sp. TaxID=1573823 RepID=UPI0029C953E3|nr:peptidase domain-containing ABC transporter [uncultured Draconibacterium sp.]
MNIKVKQRDITDCGAACLASVAAHYKLKLPVSKIRQWAGTDKKGTNAWGLIKAAEKMGMTAKGVKATPEALAEIPLPAIAHVIVKEKLQHYVVIYKVTPAYVEKMDPGTGKLEKQPIEEFKKEWTGVLILLSPSGDFVARNEKISNFKRFGFLLRPHRGTLIQALFGAVVFTILGLATSIYIQKITDHVLTNGNRNLLNLLSIIMIVILLLQVFVGSFQTMLVLKTGQLIDARLILGYYKHLLKLPQRFFDTMRTGEIVSRINDAVKIRAFINDTMINFIVNIFIVVFAFSLMFIYNWKLALIMLLVIPLYTGLYIAVNYLNKKRERKIMEQSAELESQLVESINSERTIKQLGIEEFSNIKTEVRFVSLLHSAYKSGLNSVFSGNTSLFISRIFTIILLWVGSLFVLNQEITQGELMSFYALIGYFTGPVSGLIGMNKTYQNASIAADRLFEIMDLEQETDDDLVDASEHVLGDIVFQNVSFSYGTRVDVFENFNVCFKQGEVTAIIGESGSGKTTIAALLQKLYPINEGAVYIGSTNIRYFSNQSLRQVVGIVPQNLDLFTGRVIDNIAVGEFTPDMQRVLDICTQLGIIEFIEKLPNGFNTLVGEHGATLSGGQKQRLAIARALYRNPKILIMDEATSSLDSEAENYVQETIHQLRNEGKTVIIIAHRLSTVLMADNIVVLEDGKLIEQGSHDELYAQQGKYFSLWQKQMPVFERNFTTNI